MMKVSKSIRDVYSERKPIYDGLREKVNDLINNIKDPRWHYESRVKNEESFTLKVETGRYDDPSTMEDFLACTIVVENLERIKDAERLIRRELTFHERRPMTDDRTTKRSYSFPFDDLRLYVRWSDGTGRPTEYNGLLFEVQIKTFLQHAWSIATHDLIYKSDAKSWPKERIAFQVKAMLEHAETSIFEAENLARSNALKKVDKLTERITSIITMIDELWQQTELPEDKKRLSENIDNLINNVDIDLVTLRNALIKETELGRGTKTLDLSPYAIIVQSLLNQEIDKMNKYLTAPEDKFRIYLCKELDIPEGIDRTQVKNAVLDSV